MLDLALEDGWQLAGGKRAFQMRAALCKVKGQVEAARVSILWGPAGADGVGQRRAPARAHCGSEPGGGHV